MNATTASRTSAGRPLHISSRAEPAAANWPLNDLSICKSGPGGGGSLVAPAAAGSAREITIARGRPRKRARRAFIFVIPLVMNGQRHGSVRPMPANVAHGSEPGLNEPGTCTAGSSHAQPTGARHAAYRTAFGTKSLRLCDSGKAVASSRKAPRSAHELLVHRVDETAGRVCGACGLSLLGAWVFRGETAGTVCRFLALDPAGGLAPPSAGV